MPIPAQNINLSEDIGVEVDRTAYIETSLTAAATGGYESINTSSPMHPNGSTPHGMAEWINYDHDYISNDPPNAVITGGTSASTGTQLVLSGLSSTDDNGISSYSWSNNVNNTTGSNSTYSVSSSSATTMTVTLTVTDASGLTDSDTHSIVWTTPQVNSTTLRYDSNTFSTFCACYFCGNSTVYHSGAYTHGNTQIYSSSSLSSFAPTGYYGNGSTAILWNGLGWGMPQTC
tara:strand:+ start:738 stop:1430 length:693 start_codon:yes stop_codon:yes gene_type:complete